MRPPHSTVQPDLAVGDRVRVALRRQAAGCDEAPHLADEPGHTGRVVGVRHMACAPTHPYLVLFDRPCVMLTRLGTPLALPSRHFARDELERIDVQDEVPGR